MRHFVTVGLVMAAAIGLTASAQDWYHEREGRFQGNGWRPQVFLQVRSDLDHIYSADRAADRERRRLDRTKRELTDLQANLDHGRFDNGHLNDVIDSIRKSANDDRLAPQDRQVLADDVIRLKDYQDHHNNWGR